MLLLDNCPAHPDSSELGSDDGKIFAKYLPPGVTSLIQPMDQGVLQALKQRYKKKLLQQLLIEDENGVSVPQFLKTINMKVVADYVAEAWKEIPSSTFRKSWRKILPIVEESVEPEHPPDANDSVRLVSEVSSLPSVQSEFNQAEIQTWLENDEQDPGFQLLTEEEICAAVTLNTQEDNVSDESDEDESSVTTQCPVSHSSAAYMLDKSLQWLEHQPEPTVHNVTVLRELWNLASNKRLQALTQPVISDYFRPVAS